MLHFLERGFVTLSELLTFTLTHIQAHVQTKTSNMLKYNICSAKLGNCIQHFLNQQWLKTPTSMKNGWLVVTNQYMTVQFPSALRDFSIFQLADLASTLITAIPNTKKTDRWSQWPAGGCEAVFSQVINTHKSITIQKSWTTDCAGKLRNRFSNSLKPNQKYNI